MPRIKDAVAHSRRLRRAGLRRRPSAAGRDALARTLHERVKELTLLHSAARLLHETRLTIQVVLTELAALLPPAWQHPHICRARIRYAEIDAHTPGWRDSAWKLESRFCTSAGMRGSIEVAYLERRAEAAEGPFLAEERKLIDSVAELLVVHFERRHAEEKVENLAYYEPVTGLPNRALLEEQLAAAVRAASENGHRLALFLVNLSQFRDINNTLGHRNGDEALRQVARGLREALRQDGLLASLGGDEFVMVLPHLADRAEMRQVLDAVEGCLRRPVQVAGIPVALDGAIGVALYPEHGATAELLWQRCDVALRAAKDNHQSYLLYSPEIDKYHPERIALLGELPGAIAQGQLVLHYQPKVDLRTGRTVGVEALVRWQHPVHGLIYPDRFVPLAERTQVITPLTCWVLEAAVRQCAAWRAAGIELSLSVNLSARNLADAAFCGEIPALVAACGLPLDMLTLEITESMVMADPHRAGAVMRSLADHGVAFSLDDFGVGHSSLAYLRDLPIKELKIDKSFIAHHEEVRNASIIRAVIELGHGLDLRVTAEGIESASAAAMVSGLGCDLGQGYLFSRPLPAESLLAWLRDSKRDSGVLSRG